MSLNRVLDAKSVVIVGASQDVTKRGYQAVKTLISDKYEGKIYLVNPRGETILGRTCYKSVLEINDSIDLALITTPAKLKRVLPYTASVFNPVLATKEGPVVADARILVKKT